MIERGDSDLIHAALWFSDLRDFTQLTEDLPPDQVLGMLNDYFQFVSAAVSARGGEILRFIGDAMLMSGLLEQLFAQQVVLEDQIVDVLAVGIPDRVGNVFLRSAARTRTR